MKKRCSALIALLLLVSVMTACGAGNTRQEAKQHRKDGLLGITEVNPNMPLSNTYRTYSADIRVLEAAIKERFPMVTKTSITLNGPVAHVRLNVPVGTGAEEIARIKREAPSVLAAALPRYNMDIDVSAK
ncbi:MULTISPECIES: hypothetical protein [unclassified Paenibacillus]|uniref:hypothetical protein n=1 Tax=unclassified Paenibacillus TaxID=185978 RepID=UPI001AEA0C15|nr:MULTISPECIES: hypothetical protein [unclassified Paenibacillus]MBP1153448.1 hypothetical protein [Paenibacillus sp. PvP091]MBP1171169.1 hypothetical protein [Paenibacillus sp. PvR098]MBP2442197.1 hypothetical protein [Paenibacillus sp. PvP052]